MRSATTLLSSSLVQRGALGVTQNAMSSMEDPWLLRRMILKPEAGVDARNPDELSYGFDIFWHILTYFDM